MKNRAIWTLFTLSVVFVLSVSAQRPADASATMSSGKPPDTVFIEELTWAADKVARSLGKPGTITLPEDRFIELLVMTGRSLKAGGFKTVLFLSESGGNRTGMRTAAERLNQLWKGAATAHWVDDYYTKSHSDQNKWITANLRIPEDQIGGHANLLDTSELLFVAPKHVRRDRMTGNDYPNNGVSGDPSKSTPEIGKVFLQIKVDNALAAPVIQYVPEGDPDRQNPGGNQGRD